MDRFPRLVDLARVYSGPISASIFLRSAQEYIQLQQEWQRNQDVQLHATIHVVFDHQWQEPDQPSGSQFSWTYPVNIMRNFARNHAKSMYILYLDADFVVPSDLHDQVYNGQLRTLMRQLDTSEKIVLVLPGYSSNSEQIIPKNRQDLLHLIKSGQVSRIPYNSQADVDFDRFEKENDEHHYKIEWRYMLHFEPYFIAPRSIPL